jgi:hypothetical protein
MADFTWAARLPADAVRALDALRIVPGIELLVMNRELWLRACKPDGDTLARLRGVPWSETYAVLPDRSLRPAGRFLAAGTLPDGEWLALDAALTLHVAASGASDAPPARVELRLVECREWRAPNLVVTTPAAWSAFIETASEIRISRLRFAQTDGEVVVRGDPLPSLPGEHLIEDGGIARPVGTAFNPAMSVATVRAALRLGAGEIAIWSRAGNVACIPAEAWLPADRATVRLMNPNHAH